MAWSTEMPLVALLAVSGMAADVSTGPAERQWSQPGLDTALDDPMLVRADTIVRLLA